MLSTTTEVSPIFTWTVIIVGICLLKLLIAILKEEPGYYPKYQPYRKSNHNPKGHTNTRTAPVNFNIYSFSYVKTPLLTKREWTQYYTLKEIADSKNLIICPKVRLLDLVVPRPGIKNYRGLKTRVMSKHVDFVICSYDMEVQAIIELDDTTHLRADRIKRDEFVDSVLIGAGYRVIHTWNITSDILDFIN